MTTLAVNAKWKSIFSRQMPKLSFAILLAVLLWFSSDIVWQTIAVQYLPEGSTTPPADPQKTPAPTNQTDQAFLPIFGEEPASSSSAYSAGNTSLSAYILTGTFILGGYGDNTALVESNGKTELYKQGASLGGGETITRITQECILLQTANGIERLSLNQETANNNDLVATTLPSLPNPAFTFEPARQKLEMATPINITQVLLPGGTRGLRLDHLDNIGLMKAADRKSVV